MDKLRCRGCGQVVDGPHNCNGLIFGNLPKQQPSAVLDGSIALLEIADILDKAERMGAETDKPEGARYVHISDTLLKEIAQKIRCYAAKQ